MRQPSISSLPPDVLNLLFSLLDTVDQTPLAHCAMVSKQFNSLATPLLYSHVVVRPGANLGILRPQVSEEGKEKRKNLLQVVRCLTIGLRHDMLVWNLKERMGVKATRYRESLNQIEVIVDISQPKHIIIASSPRDYPLYDAIYDGSQFLEKLKHKITLTFEVRVPPSIYQDSKTKPRKVWEVNLQSPDLQPFNLNRLSRLLWLFIPEDSSTDIRPVTLGTHSWTYFANNSAQLSDDSELVIVNSTDLLAHGKNETYPTTEECKCAAPAFFRARFRVHLTRAVNREKHKEDGSFNGMNVVDKVKERMINTRFPSMEEYQRSEAPA